LKNKITISLLCVTLVLSGAIIIPNAFAVNVPDWVKNTAGWWATDAISGADLSNANLEGANLDGTTLYNAILSNANLKCINHPICVSG
jgi:uncharacterized protein YjbI with pentapeptide repeats